jgi:hypothetical protein
VDTQTPPPGDSGSNNGRLEGATSITAILRTQQERGHKAVYRDAANGATKRMTQDTPLTMVHKTESCQNKNQHAVVCDNIQIDANSGELTV